MQRALILLIPIVAACTTDNGSTPPDTRILVVGNDMGPRVQNITLSRGTSAVTNALVTVNGIALTETASGHYAGTLPTSLAVGDTIQVDVFAGADSVTGIARVPTVPSLTTPGNRAVIHIPTPLDFTWLDTSDPDAFRAGIQHDGVAEVASYTGAARSGIVVTSRIPPTATSVSAFLYAFAEGTFTGSAHPDSRMHVRQSGGTVTLVIGP